MRIRSVARPEVLGRPGLLDLLPVPDGVLLGILGRLDPQEGVRVRIPELHPVAVGKPLGAPAPGYRDGEAHRVPVHFPARGNGLAGRGGSRPAGLRGTRRGLGGPVVEVVGERGRGHRPFALARRVVRTAGQQPDADSDHRHEGGHPDQDRDPLHRRPPVEKPAHGTGGQTSMRPGTRIRGLGAVGRLPRSVWVRPDTTVHRRTATARSTEVRPGTGTAPGCSGRRAARIPPARPGGRAGRFGRTTPVGGPSGPRRARPDRPAARDGRAAPALPDRSDGPAGSAASPR